jgi:sugar phosphate isomerase/epimerase
MNSLTPDSDRRRFLTQSAALGAASVFFSSVPTLYAGAPAVGVVSTAVPAADPIVRTGTPLLKLSLAAYSLRDLLVRRGTPEQIAASPMSIESFIDYCAEQGLGAVELTGYYFPAVITTEYLLSIRQRTHRLGLAVSATAIGNDFCLPEGKARKQQLAECRQWIDYAAAMGAPAIRIFAGTVPQGDSEDAAVERCAAGISESLKYAAQRGVFLALENHGGITSTPEQMLKIIRAVDPSPWFGVNLDSGNFQTADPYGDLEKIAPFAVNVQIKAAMLRNGKKEPADLKRIVSILKNAGYRGYVAFEYEEDEPALEAVPRYLRQLAELLG